MLSDTFPGRLQRIIVYPVPWVLNGLWGIIRPFLHPETASRVILLRGVGRSSPEAPDNTLSCPKALCEHVPFESFRKDMRARHQDLCCGMV